ncbi:MAG: Gfo/Idh/MocA family oxidoreductase [Bacteroidales bacterium]|nr:Gfo/Idh/MocA family oxidoreductase [Bacteroidales bacterium]
MADNNKNNMDRRSFLGTLGSAGLAAAALTSFPWMTSCTPKAASEVRGEKTRIGIIGPGSRGQLHITQLLQMPEAEIVALCDIYEPNLQAAAAICPGSKLYRDYREPLDDKDVDSVVITVPLFRHYEIAKAAFAAGKNVFCEKAMCYTIDECYDLYKTGVASGKIFFVGQQRLFDPKYLKAFEIIKSGELGPIVNVRNYWFRNGDWRRPCEPEYERHINWRLYREYSRGLMTELACHQIQNGTWALGMYPEKVMGSGSTIFWKDGREVFDNVAVIYTFPNGINMTFESVISNKHFGMGEYILCNKGTVDLTRSRLYYENPAPKSGMRQLLGEIENNIFTNSAFAGTSFVAETGSEDKGVSIMPEGLRSDGTFEIMQAFCRAAITGVQPPKILEEAYYASVYAILGDEALLQEKTLTLDDKYKI